MQKLIRNNLKTNNTLFPLSDAMATIFALFVFVQLLFEGSIGKHTDIIDDWIQYAQGNGLWGHLHNWADILLI